MFSPQGDSSHSDVRDVFAEVCTIAGEIAAEERTRAEHEVERLYSLSGREPPAIIWCRSLYQLLTLPSLLFAILHSDLWQMVHSKLNGRDITSSKSWQQRWNDAWSEIWITTGSPILRGINATSRVGHEYGYLEGAMISDLKSALATNIRNSRWGHAQEYLKREIYRKFWYSPHQRLMHNNFEEESLRLMLLVLSEAQQLPQADEIGLLAEEAKVRGRDTSELFQGLATRLGSEPHLQFLRVTWLPEQMYWLAAAEFISQTSSHPVLERIADRLISWLALARVACGVMAHEGVVFICERPQTCLMNERYRLHNPDGPALTFADGLHQYAWNGIIVPEFVIKNQELITVERIEKETNVEIRRVFLEIYGETRFIADSGIVPVQEDPYGTLYRKEFPNDEPLVMVRVLNASPEPDGTFKHYFLRVPPNIQTAQEAVAWTFDIEEAEDYGPEVET